MKFALLFLAVLPFVLSVTEEEDAAIKRHYRHLSKQERLDLHAAYNRIKQWFHDHGKDLTTGACGVACASATFVETLGLSAPLCAAACGLIAVFG